MPRRDPITGCEVMTLGEFWADEAEREGQGRSGGELAAEFYDDLNAEMERQKNIIRTDLEETRTILQTAIKEWNEADPEAEPVPEIVRVLEVLEVMLKVKELDITAKCLTTDGRTIKVRLTEWREPGSFYSPPDYDVNITWSVES